MKTRLDVYLTEVKKMQRLEDGWVLDGHIDGDALMFNSMLYAAQRLIPNSGLIAVNLLAAMREDGKLYRKPISSGNAYPTISKSEISRDMVLGLMFGLVVGECPYAKSVASTILTYSSKHYGVLGRGLLTRTRMTHNLKTLLKRLSGRRKWYDFYIPTPMLLKGYQAHLDVLSIYLRWYTGRLGLLDRQRLRRYALSQSENALFCIIDNVVNGYRNLVEMQEEHFPSDTLPDSLDRKAHYLWERSQGTTDWQPLNDVSYHRHVPFDYLIVQTLLHKYYLK